MKGKVLVLYLLLMSVVPTPRGDACRVGEGCRLASVRAIDHVGAAVVVLQTAVLCAVALNP